MRKGLLALAALAIVALVAYVERAPPGASLSPRAALPVAPAPKPVAATEATSSAATRTVAGGRTVAEAFAAHARDVAVEDRGVVEKLLRDDREGRRHQRFLVRVADGTTVLIAHNIELAPRIEPLAPGDAVSFRGEYVWNAKGGIVHWTHDDPDGRHAGGWVEVDGRRFH